MSCILYHGPGARELALAEAAKIGRLLAPPFGDEGLKTARAKPADPPGAREIVELMSMTPLGSQIGCLVIGPMDDAEVKAANVLLKTIEEFRSDLFQPILWANDLEGVLPTIQSRCLARWAGEVTAPDPEMQDDAATLVQAYLDRDAWKVPEIVAKYQDREHLLLQRVATVIQEKQAFDLWPAIRELASLRNPTQIEVVAAFLEEA